MTGLPRLKVSGAIMAKPGSVRTRRGARERRGTRSPTIAPPIPSGLKKAELGDLRIPDSLDKYPPLPRSLLELANTLPGYRYRRALRHRAQMRAQLKRVFTEVDFVIAPTLSIPPPLRDVETVTIGGKQVDFTMALIRYTFVFDHTQNPVVSLPILEAAPGIGASVQVVADTNRDADAVNFAVRLEARVARAE